MERLTNNERNWREFADQADDNARPHNGAHGWAWLIVVPFVAWAIWWLS